VVKAMDLHPANMGSSLAGSHMSHWWRQEGHLAKKLVHCISISPGSQVQAIEQRSQTMLNLDDDEH